MVFSYEILAEFVKTPLVAAAERYKESVFLGGMLQKFPEQLFYSIPKCSY